MFLAFFLVSEFNNVCAAAANVLPEISCPLWHVRYKDGCKCGHDVDGFVACTDDQKVIVNYGFCMTWNNITHSAILNRCPFTYQFADFVCPQQEYIDSAHPIPINISGPELNRLTCNKFNRQGTQCRECRDGYRPAAFSDGFSCADCSKHRHLWILNLFLQLTMVTLMYLVVILFQIKGTSSPLSVIITDGTEGTPDYRAFCTLYMLMRIVCGAVQVVYRHHCILGSYFFGLSHIFLGTFFLIAMLYRNEFVDGLIVLSIGMLLLIPSLTTNYSVSGWKCHNYDGGCGHLHDQ